MLDRGQALTIGDLLAESAFGLELVSGGCAATERLVLGAHTVEVDRPTRWLAEGWVMLSTGMRLRGRRAEQLALIDELDEAGVAALGFGVGVVFKRVPSALLHAAREREFPVLVVPLETKFRDIIRFIDSSLVGGDAQLFHRLTALQRFLADALSAPEPERAMVERLSRFLDVSVVVLDETGQLQIAAGEAPIEELRAAAAGSRSAGLLELDAAGWHAIATPIPAPEPAAPRWLVLASRRQGLINQLIKPAATASAPLLAATARLRDAVRGQERAVRAALLSEVLEPSRGDPLTLAARAAAFGLDCSSPARLIVIRVDADGNGRAAAGDNGRAAAGGKGHAAAGGNGAGAAADPGTLALHLSDGFERHGVSCLVAARLDSVAALAQAEPAQLRPILEELGLEDAGAAIGVGRPIASLSDAPQSLRDAELAAHRARAEHPPRVLLFEDLDIATFLMGEIPHDRLAPWLDGISATLRANPPLRQALDAYFAHDLDVAAAAAALHLHPNSLRYRLGRLERLLGISLRKPSAITSLYIALIADAVPGQS